MPDLLALVPVNQLDRAKGRLAGVLDERARRELALATLQTVLAALRDARMTAVVLTRDRMAAIAAEQAGARVLDEDPEATGLNGQLESAISRLDTGGGLLILHADLPLVSGHGLRELAAKAWPSPSATLVRSTDGGTNAMLLRPPGGFALAYGPGSFERHLAAASAAGYHVATAEIEELAIDLDTPDDLATFMRMPGARLTAAGRVLATAGVPQLDR